MKKGASPPLSSSLAFVGDYFAATVVAAMPETFEDLRALFTGATLDERRAPLERRDPLDRRVFPPRPEGRRVGQGRRASEPLE